MIPSTSASAITCATCVGAGTRSSQRGPRRSARAGGSIASFHASRRPPASTWPSQTPSASAATASRTRSTGTNVFPHTGARPPANAAAQIVARGAPVRGANVV
jgi:hypothetical protein